MGVRTKGSCRAHPNTALVWGSTASTVCRNTPRPCLLPGLSQTVHVLTMRDIQIGGVLNQQDPLLFFPPLTGVVEVGMYHCLNGPIFFVEQSIQGDHF